MPLVIQTNRAGQQTQAPMTFLFKNCCFRLLIRDRCFVLLSALPC